jgi:uncharacterized protein YeaO (DUF488 family)
MAIRIVRLGAPRYPAEGLRLGTVRRPPRGVKKADYSRRDYFDVWLPDLAPSAALLSWARSMPLTERHWQIFVRRYRAEMAKPPARRLIVLLATLSAEADFSVGCFCQDELRCHRSVLRELLAGAGATLA